VKKLIPVMLLVAASVYAQSTSSTQDGVWWKALPPLFKHGFVTGYVEGVQRPH